MKGTRTGRVGERLSYHGSVDGDAEVSGNHNNEAHREPLVFSPYHTTAAAALRKASKEMTFPLPPSTRPDPRLDDNWTRPSTPVSPTARSTASSSAFTIQDIYVPSRFSSSSPAANKQRLDWQKRMGADTTFHKMAMLQNQRGITAMPSLRSVQGTGKRGTKSSADSVMSYVSSTLSVDTQSLAPLQHKENLDDVDRLSPLLEDDPKCFDLVGAAPNEPKIYSLETRSKQLMSREHMEAIFKDTTSLLQFTAFLNAARPASVSTLNYYLTALKALQAIKYTNALTRTLHSIPGLDFTQEAIHDTQNDLLQEKADRALDVLVRDDLPAFVTHLFIQIASISISKRITGNMPLMLQEASEGLAEVFCLTDPSRTDNPIIFTSEEFHRTTQYGVNYAIGRNCRFLQGPSTNRNSVDRFRTACQAGKEHSEIFLNYRRDGSPFMNLLMVAPLMDSRGNLRYFIGAQIDVSGLVKECTDLQAFQRMLEQEEDPEDQSKAKGEFRELSEMFDTSELSAVRKYGGNMHREHFEESNEKHDHRGIGQRVLIQDHSTLDLSEPEKISPKADGRLSGPYKHYLLVRPAPSLRILFTSPSLRIPGVLQSPFLDRIGGNQQIRDSLADALADASRGVTAKIRWLPHAVADIEDALEEGRPRWIHCTPLLGASGSVGVWMVVLIDEKDRPLSLRRLRPTSP